jgi:hypothetical protein
MPAVSATSKPSSTSKPVKRFGRCVAQRGLEVPPTCTKLKHRDGNKLQIDPECERKWVDEEANHEEGTKKAELKPSSPSREFKVNLRCSNHNFNSSRIKY